MKGVGSRIREQYGYEISNTTYLYAEEALYLVEIVSFVFELIHFLLVLYFRK